MMTRSPITHAGFASLAALGSLISLAAITSSPAVAQQPGASFSLTVTQLSSTNGQLIVCLFREKADFPECEEGDGTWRRTYPITGATTRIQVPLPAAGNYAVTVFHDENRNGRLGQNFIGMPTEGVGVSGNPGGMPRYARSQVPLAAGSTITIQMRYLFD
ncbi:DUF2141 domain-containing protein [Alteraurantiacibacter aestuarii]|uniref:DUF2141 domain-containing protein n=1 Tax=Alteraurantiacibacter aestuarii TaxID=650004 RepID=A0A844ZG85_9SPHN|nr:DUF2141 domain-containing protein [Alteraurantiacibacter aestuarii]MXO87531.1 DUF2141 domain-containing protein [Alteraurantiacibacter aestuarii]